MPIIKVTDNQTGETYRVNWSGTSSPTDEDIDKLISAERARKDIKVDAPAMESATKPQSFIRPQSEMEAFLSHPLDYLSEQLFEDPHDVEKTFLGVIPALASGARGVAEKIRETEGIPRDLLKAYAFPYRAATEDPLSSYAGEGALEGLATSVEELGKIISPADLASLGMLGAGKLGAGRAVKPAAEILDLMQSGTAVGIGGGQIVGGTEKGNIGDIATGTLLTALGAAGLKRRPEIPVDRVLEEKITIPNEIVTPEERIIIPDEAVTPEPPLGAELEALLPKDVTAVRHPIPVENIPDEGLRKPAANIAIDVGRRYLRNELAYPDLQPDNFVNQLPDELKPHAKEILDQTWGVIQSRSQGMEWKADFNRMFADEIKGRPDGPFKIETSNPNNYFILDIQDGQAIQGAHVVNNKRASIFGGKMVDSPRSFDSTVGKILDDLGAKPSDTLTMSGTLRQIRRGEYGRNKEAGARELESGGRIPPEITEPTKPPSGVEGEVSAIPEPVTDSSKQLTRIERELDTRRRLGIYDKAKDTPQLEAEAARLREELSAVNKVPVEEDFGPPPAEPPLEIDLPPEPEPPKVEIGRPGIIKRALLPTEKILEEIHPELAKKAKTYELQVEREASRGIAFRRRVTEGLDKKQQREVVDFLDKGKISSDPLVMKAGEELRTLLDNIALKAESQNVFIGYRENYFPHKFDTGLWEFDVSPKGYKSKDRPFGSLEKAREGEGGRYRRDLGVLDEYIADAERRISEAEHLGKSLQKVSGPEYAGPRPIAEYQEKAFERLTGRERSSVPSRIAGGLRYITALSDLAFTAPLQYGQLGSIVARGGPIRTAKAVAAIVRDRRGQAMKALESGALWPTISHETSRAYGSKGFMWGTPTADMHMRIVGNTVGRILADDAARGGKFARAQLKQLGFDIKPGEQLSTEQINAISKRFADYTNYRTGTLEMPLWTKSALGKLTSQYTAFMYQHSGFVKDLFASAAKGNIRPLATYFAFAAPVMGEIVSDIRSGMKGENPFGEYDEFIDEFFSLKPTSAGTWEKILRNQRISLNNPKSRLLQNIASIGGAGIFQIFVERLISGEFPENLMGPAVQNVMKGLKSTKESVRQRKAAPVGRWALQQIPGYGYDIAREVYPTERDIANRAKKSKLFGDYDLTVNLE